LYTNVCAVLYPRAAKIVSPQEIRAAQCVVLARGEGKGSGLKACFARAHQQKKTHVVTLDSSGRLGDDSLRILCGTARKNPRALVIGVRRREKKFPARLFIYFRRYAANIWIRLFTGISLQDTRSSMRVYPLKLVQNLRLRSSFNDIDQEIILKAAWNYFPLRECSVRDICKHRHSISAELFSALVFAGLTVKAFFHRFVSPFSGAVIPGETMAEKIRNLISHELRAHISGFRAAFSVSAGIFLGIFPIHGFQVITLLFLAPRLRLNRPLAFLGLNISCAPLMPFLIVAAIQTGAFVLGEVPRDVAGADSEIFAQGITYVLQFFTGSIILAPLVSLVSFGILFPVFSRLITRRP
jgi:uncharacterized protein (DUF2062 family)